MYCLGFDDVLYEARRCVEWDLASKGFLMENLSLIRNIEALPRRYSHSEIFK